jgi:hypothetical protein
MLSQGVISCQPSLAEVKITVCETWKAFPEVTDGFIELQGMVSGMSEESILLI